MTEYSHNFHFDIYWLYNWKERWFSSFVLQEANGCDNDIQELRGHQVELSQQLEDRQVHVQHLQGQSDTLDGDIERLFEQKQKVN